MREAERISCQWRIKNAVAKHKGCLVCGHKPVIWVIEDKGFCENHKEQAMIASRNRESVKDADAGTERILSARHGT